MSFVPKIVRLFHEFVVDAIFAPPLFLTFFIFFIDSLQTFFEMAFSPIFTKMGQSQHLFLYFCLFNTVDSKKCSYKSYNSCLPMTGFEPQISGVGSNHSTN